MPIKKIYLMLVLSLFVSVPQLFADLRAPEPPVDNPHPAVSEADKKRVAFAEQVIKLLQVRDSLKQKFTLDMTPDCRSNSQPNISEKCFLSADWFKQADKSHHYIDAFKAHFGPVKTYKHVHIIPWSFEKFQNQQNVKSQAVVEPTAEVVVREKKSEAAEISSEEMRAPKDPTARSKFRAEDVENMVVPEVLPGEYMIHSYVLFDDTLFNDLQRGWHHLNIIVSEDEKGELKLQRLFTTPLPYDKLPPGVVC